MMTPDITGQGGGDAFARVLGAAERAEWRLDDVLAEDARFDFSRPFLPEALTGQGELDLADEREALLLNHLRAHGYLGLFGIVEEMILPFVLAHARAQALVELDPVRALLRFAAEEAKHIALFRRFARVFERGFGRRPALIGPADAFARTVLEHSALGVALAVLHIEWMTQEHWLACARSDEAIEPAFKQLLRVHWIEEASHARMDALLVERLLQAASGEARERALDDYLAIVGLLDRALEAQVRLDRETFELAAGRPLAPCEAATFQARQHGAQRALFLCCGMTHPRFHDSLQQVSPSASARVRAAARALATPPPLAA